MSFTQLEFVALDIETTGFDISKDQIIEVGLYRYCDGNFEEFQTFINFNGILPLRIRRLTGIQEQDLSKAPGLADTKPYILDFIGDLPIVGHNVDFDLSFLTAQLDHNFTNQSYDTLELSQLIYPLIGSHRLSKLVEFLSIPTEKVHRALEDAKATAQLFRNIISELSNLDMEVITFLDKFLTSKQWRHKTIFSALLRDRLKTYNQSKISGIYSFLKNTLDGEERLFNLPKAVKKEKGILNIKELEELADRDGLLGKHFPNYEDRPEQREMLVSVGRAFNEEKHLVIEAGTGTGKSLAYLIPTIYWAVRNSEPVIVATHTINLQEQLWIKDIPLLNRILGLEFSTVLVKGRSNYVCLRKWFNLLAVERPHSPDQLKFVLRIFFWLTKTEIGDKTELNFSFAQSEFWQQISCEADNCLGARCSWYKDWCFLMKTRRRAQSAHVIIINHSLLFSDIKTENNILPHSDRLIIDEAHHLEDGATEHLGYQFSFKAFFKYINTLTGKNNENNMGFIKSFRIRSAKIENFLSDEERKFLHEQLDKIEETVDIIKDYSNNLYSLLVAVGSSGNKGSESTYTLRIKDEDRNHSNWSAIRTVYDNFSLRLKILQESLQKICVLLELKGEKFMSDSKDFSNFAVMGQEYLSTLDFILENPELNFVYWLEIQEKLSWSNCILRAAPIKVNQLLYENLFSSKKSVILTSATLTVNETYDHLLERLGLNLLAKERLLLKQLESPFDYDNKVLLCVPKDLASPLEVNDERYTELITPFIKEVVQFYGGKTMILFTSHKMLKDTYYKLKEDLETVGICLLGHNIDGSRSKLVEEFKSSERTVLLGASSFWEGVDIPGDSLKCVIIVKLPFWAPNIPTVEARLEDLDQLTNNSFKGFSVPQAIIRFKQGFGRLIRSSQDEGTIIILDKRIIEKNYGKLFFKSLPLRNHYRGTLNEIIKKIKQWHSGDRPAFTTIIDTKKDLNKLLRHKKEILKDKNE